ncbi:MAG: SDR family oxidoreductase [Rhodospirillales bacterium]|nr:SDR family oxidoreductase [Rhodospirillales bacterium]
MAEGAIAVTGASRGIGAAIALELARRGYVVGCLTRKGRGVEQGKIDSAIKGRLLNVACDVTDEASIAGALDQVSRRTGGLRGLVNNAGIHIEGESATLPTATYEEVMRVNATAAFVASREAHRHLAAAGGGLIVNIGSYFDKVGVKGTLAYCTSKAAVGAITRCLAVEWARDNIAVVDVAPGYVETDLNREFLRSDRGRTAVERRVPMRRAGQPEEVARLVAALFGEDIKFLTGETIYLDGAQGINP